MKKHFVTFAIALLFAGTSALQAQNTPNEYLGLPGDNLNLYAVMNLFQESETLEGFERSLNDPESMINNLDLNGDRLVDYIMIHDYVDGNIHSIVLRVALNQHEQQDVAVFIVERFRDGSVQVQLIGDEALYGPNYIIEPNYAETPNPGYRGNVNQQRVSNPQKVQVVHTTYYEVARWPLIVYISNPVYRPWRSVWYWGYYPSYWNPWTPHYWHYYYGYHYNWYPDYYAYYRSWDRPRTVKYKTVYRTSIRQYSPTVVVNVNKGVYKSTYSRPDQRKEGEVLYSRRQSRGTTMPAARSAASPANTSRARAASGQDTRVATPANTSRPVRVSNSGTTTAPRSQQTSSPRSVSTTRERQSSADRPAVTPAKRQEDVAQPRTRVSDVKPEVKAPARSQTSTRNTPTVSKRETQKPATKVKSNPAPSRSQAAPEVKSSEKSSRSRSTGTAVQKRDSGSSKSSSSRRSGK